VIDQPEKDSDHIILSILAMIFGTALFSMIVIAADKIIGELFR